MSDDSFSPPHRRREVYVWTGVLLAVCVAAARIFFWDIDRTVPYPRHVDEGFISGPAHQTVTTGTLHPHTFNYPSLPKYLAAAGLAAGFVRGAASLEIREIRTLGNVGYPYYEVRRPMQTARQLFALLAVIALAGTGASAWLALRRPVAIVLAPLIVLASPLFVLHAWEYLNVDVVGTTFVVLTLVACLIGTERPTLARAAILPGALAGFATGSKYTLAVAILPVLVAIGLFVPSRRKLQAALTACAAMVAAFLLVVPYSLLDIPGFLDGLAAEAFHYASGHEGFSDEPGLTQLLFYLRHFVTDFGVVAIVVAAIGWGAFVASDWRRSVVMASFPVALLWLLSGQTVRFPRNVLSIHPFVAIYAAFGVQTIYAWGLRFASVRGWTRSRLTKPLLAGATLALAAAAVHPGHLAGLVRDRADSRTVAEEWIEKELPASTAVLIPSELGFDVRHLEASGRMVKTVNMHNAVDPGAMTRLLRDVPGPAVLLRPEWTADPRYPDQEDAEALNHAHTGLQEMERFGTNEVLANYWQPVPRGDPAFSVVVLR
ncbi:MAG: ArnT family glycosyltransferase [Vicinamibacterales bacterium]